MHDGPSRMPRPAAVSNPRSRPGRVRRRVPRTSASATLASSALASTGRRQGRTLQGILLASVVLWAAGPVSAHQTNSSYAMLAVREDTLILRVVIDEYDLLNKLRFDPDQDGLLTREEMDHIVPNVFAFVEPRISLRADDGRLVLERRAGGVEPDRKGNLFVAVGYGAAVGRRPGRVELGLDYVGAIGAEHTCLATVMLADTVAERAVFGAGNTRQTFVVPAPDESAVSRLAGALRRWFQ